MGGGHHLKIPDYKTYDSWKSVWQLRAHAARLATMGLKDPWIRNQMWIFDKSFDAQRYALLRMNHLEGAPGANDCPDALEIPHEIAQRDPLREIPLRFLGYTNEVGEAFRSLVRNSVVRGSYVVACAYVVSDTFDKSARTYQKYALFPFERGEKVRTAALDTLVWQSFASVIIPGLTINRLCFLSKLALRRYTKLPVLARHWATTALGLAAIPVIVHPIDRFVHWAMDATVRPWYLLKTDRIDFIHKHQR